MATEYYGSDFVSDRLQSQLTLSAQMMWSFPALTQFPHTYLVLALTPALLSRYPYTNEVSARNLPEDLACSNNDIVDLKECWNALCRGDPI